MQLSSHRGRNRHRESICVFTHPGPEADVQQECKRLPNTPVHYTHVKSHSMHQPLTSLSAEALTIFWGAMRSFDQRT